MRGIEGLSFEQVIVFINITISLESCNSFICSSWSEKKKSDRLTSIFLNSYTSFDIEFKRPFILFLIKKIHFLKLIS